MSPKEWCASNVARPKDFSGFSQKHLGWIMSAQHPWLCVFVKSWSQWEVWRQWIWDLYWWMATLHGLLPPASQLLSSIYLYSCLSLRTGGSSPWLAGSQVCSATPDQAAPHTNSGLTSIHSEPQQNNTATAFYFTITHAWTFCSCCLQVLHP